MKKVYINQYNYITSLGANAQENWDALLLGESGIYSHDNFANLKKVYASIIPNSYLSNILEAYDVSTYPRIVKMALAALVPLIQKYPINPNTVLLLSTTKGDISALQDANLAEASIPFLAEQIAIFFGFRKKPIIVSNACVSGALALATAKRLIQSEMIDEAIVIGIDEVTEFVVSGFNSFQAMSDEPCTPYDANRKGVNLGEAVAVAYVSANALTKNSIEIVGDGAINDANHISGPSRTGEGLYQSILSAMNEANIKSSDINYISSHGTATMYNDEMEAIAFDRLKLNNVPVSSLKGYFGHTLGASGLLETLITCQMMQNNIAIANKGLNQLGVSVPIHVISENVDTPIKYALKTASGFGGCNTALILKKVQ